MGGRLVYTRFGASGSQAHRKHCARAAKVRYEANWACSGNDGFWLIVPIRTSPADVGNRCKAVTTRLSCNGPQYRRPALACNPVKGENVLSRRLDAAAEEAPTLVSRAVA